MNNINILLLCIVAALFVVIFSGYSGCVQEKFGSGFGSYCNTNAQCATKKCKKHRCSH
jgi:hypothetical protein